MLMQLICFTSLSCSGRICYYRVRKLTRFMECLVSTNQTAGKPKTKQNKKPRKLFNFRLRAKNMRPGMRHTFVVHAAMLYFEAKDDGRSGKADHVPIYYKSGPFYSKLKLIMVPSGTSQDLSLFWAQRSS
ncbi:hypothetical protein RRG08_060478 [Elysia crispata]|uniref:Uncharacterized protein n=1 Tax=Elysia crispata TaxID=231223 RepID=A0AAE1B0L8_9GAST|nr:hypothetical protein RRG08_060478 [Elysia crispata]